MVNRARVVSILGMFLAVATATPSLAQSYCANVPLGPSVGQWQRWEQTLTSSQDYVGADKRGNPYRDLQIKVTFTNCSNGATFQTYGFWYGVQSTTPGHWNDAPKLFRVRGAFPAGTWQWQTSCSGKTTAVTSAIPPVPVSDCINDAGLNQKGRFQVTSGGSNALFSNGFLNISGDGHFLTYAKTGPAGTVQGPPFFWLGDTAWSASIAATQNDWQTYINAQATSPTGKPNTAFTVVHLAVSPKAAGTVDANGNPPFDQPADPSCQPDSTQAPSYCNDWDPRYWAALDDKIQYANQKGLVVFLAGIMEPLQKDLTYLTAAPPAPTSKGLSTLATNTAARYAGNFVVLSPGFDHQIAPNLTLIREIGSILSNNAIFRGLVTNHPAGGSSFSDLKTLQPDLWLDFQMFQSGSAGTNNSTELANITDRASSLALNLVALSPLKPVVNGEATYDGAIADPTNPSTVNHTPYRARQTAYLSFLSGAKGYSAGTCGILDWSTGIAGCTSGWTWSFGLTRETSVSMKDLRFILQSVNWQLLHPEHARIQNQAPLRTRRWCWLMTEARLS